MLSTALRLDMLNDTWLVFELRMRAFYLFKGSTRQT